MLELSDELENRANELLKDKQVKEVKFMSKTEILIQFHDDARFYINHVNEGFDFSIT